MADSGIDRLTDEQRECLRLVLDRKSSKEIAQRLGIGPSAVDKRIERAIRTLGFEDTAEYAFFQGAGREDRRRRAARR